MKGHTLVLAVMIMGIFTLVTAPIGLHAWPPGGVIITTTVKSGVVTAWNIGCTGDRGNGACAVDIMKESKNWTDEQIDQFDALVGRFEQINGVALKSNLAVKRFHVTPDVIQTVSKGPATGPGQALCDWLRANCPSLKK